MSSTGDAGAGRSAPASAPTADTTMPTKGGAVALVLIAIGAPVGVTLGVPELWVPAAFAAIATLLSWLAWVVYRPQISVTHAVPVRGMNGRPLATTVAAGTLATKRPVIVAIDAGPAGLRPEPVFTKIDGARTNPPMRIEFPAPTRGLAAWKDVHATQLSPFGFTQRRLVFAAPPSTVIWPRMVTLELDGGRAPAMDGVANRRLSQTSRAELSALLREYRDGDDLRHVHWPSSARVGSLLVRQVDETNERTLALHVEVRGRALADPDADGIERDNEDEPPHDLYERACSVACSIAMAALTAGVHVNITTGGGLHLESADYLADPYCLIDVLAQTLPADLAATRSENGRAASNNESAGASSLAAQRTADHSRTLRIDVVGTFADNGSGGKRAVHSPNRIASGPHRPAPITYTIDVSAADSTAQPPDQFTILCPRLDLLSERWHRWHLHAGPIPEFR